MNDKVTPLKHNTPEGWFVRMQQPVDATTEAEFYEWLQQPGNAAAYEQCCEIWGFAESMTDDPHIERYINAIYKPAKHRNFITYGALASAAALLVFALLLKPWQESLIYYQTNLGERKEITLEDGSTVVLNTKSKIGVSYKSGQRYLTLTEGEALFKVAKDKARPFIVSTGEGQVTAIGTRFGVWRDGAITKVSVLEGKVSVGRPDRHKDNNTAILVAGQAISYGEDGKVGAIHSADEQRIYAWIAGRLIFQEVPMAQAIREYNRYTSKPLVIKGEDLQNTPISGAFQTGNAAAFVTALKELLPVEIQETEHNIIISPAR
jgi:transmembrane sensor